MLGECFLSVGLELGLDSTGSFDGFLGDSVVGFGRVAPVKREVTVVVVLVVAPKVDFGLRIGDGKSAGTRLSVVG